MTLIALAPQASESMSTLQIFGIVAVLMALGILVDRTSPIARARDKAEIRRLKRLWRTAR